MYDKIARKTVPMYPDPGIPGSHREHSCPDDPDDRRIIAVKAHTVQDREDEIIRIKSHDPDLLAPADRIGLLLRLDRDDLGDKAQFPVGDGDIIVGFGRRVEIRLV